MFRFNQVVTLLASLLIAFGSTAQAQDDACKQKTQECGCKQTTVVVKKQQVCPQPQARQKPYVESKPAARSIAPRDLPVVYEQEALRAADAARVLSTSTAQDMIKDAKAVAVIPSMKKGAFVFGARWGKGLMTMRDEDGHWQPPSYIDIAGGNWGFQAGFQSTDLVLIFTSDSGIRSLLRGRLTLNADASAAAGPWGRKLQVGTPILLNSGIYAFSRSRGLFAGISLDGAVISVDNTSNARVYGKNIDGSEILLYRRVEPNTVVAPFLNAMERYSPPTTQQAQADTTADTTTDD
jgi:lipid-binding SYLF domain-containing protein